MSLFSNGFVPRFFYFFRYIFDAIHFFASYITQYISFLLLKFQPTYLQTTCQTEKNPLALPIAFHHLIRQQVNTIELQKAQITSLERQLRPSIQKRLKEAQELSDLKDENMALEYELNRQKDLMARLMQRVEAALTFLEEKLPEQFRPYVQRARAHIMPEPKQEHRHDRGMSMGGMSR